ncbi:MAG: nitrate reductase cytochrome c-type subunit [Rubrivivax sp.]|nr:nitrate reductase cytochrome c-type subunit [Rubrivivax sp.]
MNIRQTPRSRHRLHRAGPFLTAALAQAAIAAAALAGCAAMTIDDREFGLRKTSVFEVVTPAPFDFESTAAGRMLEPLPGSGMPPMINHAIDDSLPITAAKNECLSCHDKPQNIGKPVAAGKARPAPASHYSGAPGSLRLAGASYNCVSCHAPQADVPMLVRNASR